VRGPKLLRFAARNAGGPSRRWMVAAACAAAALAAVWCLLPDDAWARVGGGQSYGSRRSSGRSSFSGGGGGGGDVDLGLILFLIRLLVEYPAIGVPVVIVVGAVWVLNHRSTVATPRTRRVERAVPAVPRQSPGLAALRAADPDFSLPVFLDFAVLVHRRALDAVADRRSDDALSPFVEPRVLTQLRGRPARSVTEVVCGAVRLVKVEQTPTEDRVFVRLESTRVEVGPDGPQRWMIEDWLAFRRAHGARSLPPESMEALACPSCGSPVEVNALGACTHCGSAITKGQLQWQLVYAEERSRERVDGPQLALGPGGDEPGLELPVVVSPTLAPDRDALQPFDEPAFQGRVRTTYLELQAAWTEGRWQRARPFTTDRMFQTLRFWMDQYAESGLRNVLEDVALLESRIVEVSTDRWFHAVTVRIVGRMKDSTVDASGAVVAGNAERPRRFAEYWTFVRSAEGPATTHGAAAQCPSCGAPLDRVDQTGVCGYCSAKITSGRFDWVLSRIEQPAAYR
jgi:hypothetical protein